MTGTTVTLYKQVPVYVDQQETQIQTDEFGVPVFTEVPITVEDVIVGEPTTEDITISTEMYQKTIRYMLGIPKGDTNDWMDKKVSWTDAYGVTHICKTFGFPITGIEANIPTRWHMKVRCEDYG